METPVTQAQAKHDESFLVELVKTTPLSEGLLVTDATDRQLRCIAFALWPDPSERPRSVALFAYYRNIPLNDFANVRRNVRRCITQTKNLRTVNVCGDNRFWLTPVIRSTSPSAVSATSSPDPDCINLTKEVAKWEKQGSWSVAPNGLAWITAGSRLQVGANVQIHCTSFLCDGVVFEDNVLIQSHVQLRPRVYVGANVTIGLGSTVHEYAQIANYSVLGAHSKVYPTPET